MLPMTLHFFIVMIASAIKDRLQRKLDYVEEERRILQGQLDAFGGGKKIFFTADQRRRLAEAGKPLSPGRTPEVLPDRRAGDDSGLIPAVRGLKVEIGRTTVANILAEAGIEPAPEREKRREGTARSSAGRASAEC